MDYDNIPNDNTNRYYHNVSEIIKKAMKQRGYTQQNIIDECNNRFGIKIAQSTISKILNPKGKGHLSLIFVSAICQVLDIDMNKILSIREQDYSDILLSSEKTVSKNKSGDFAHGETLISNPNHAAFNGYVNNDFNIFFYPTISSEYGMLSGTLSFINEDNEFCKVSMIINTTSESKKHTKEYHGRMLISLQQQSCYCIVTSEKLGEVCSLFFFHRFFSNSNLKVRLAVASTISAGDSRRPTMHRAVICERGVIVNEKQKEFIASQLLLNNSRISISEENFEILSDKENLKTIFSMIKERARPAERVYTIEESDILKLPKCKFSDIAEAIALLRVNSLSQRYNKIGAKCDDMIYKYLFREME